MLVRILLEIVLVITVIIVAIYHIYVRRCIAGKNDTFEYWVVWFEVDRHNRQPFEHMDTKQYVEVYKGSYKGVGEIERAVKNKTNFMIYRVKVHGSKRISYNKYKNMKGGNNVF